MPLVTTKKMFAEAQSKGIAVGAFNIENMEMAQAVIAAAVELNCAVIIQTTPSTLKYGSVSLYAAMIGSLANDAAIPVALHLDHGNSLELVESALAAGYSSVMFDGSLLPYEENIAMTRKVVKKAGHIPVEAELGGVGGKEDDLDSEIDYTDPDGAADFVEQTGADSLAIAIGTAHGLYKGIPKLDIDRLVEISKKVHIPTVLHGASGLSKEVVQRCIKEGICKVNFATELRIAYSDGVKKYLKANPYAFDPKTYGKSGYEKVKAVAMEKMAMCLGL